MKSWNEIGPRSAMASRSKLESGVIDSLEAQGGSHREASFWLRALAIHGSYRPDSRPTTRPCGIFVHLVNRSIAAPGFSCRFSCCSQRSLPGPCLLYTSDAADERSSVDLG